MLPQEVLDFTGDCDFCGDGMRLISLEINNFRVIRNVRLSFPDKVIGIIGPNGAGKSSIVEAVSWALYGNQAARTGKDEIKSVFARPTDNCEVSLAFSINEQKYRVIRRLVGKTERAEVELYRGDSSESVGVNETKTYVGQLLGLDWRGFLSSFLARQQELNALSDLQPSKRRDHIAGMLGIERLDKAIQKVKDDTRLHQDKGRFLETQLADKAPVESRIQQLEELVSGLDEPLSRLESEHHNAGKQFKTVEQEFNETQRKKERWTQLKAEIEAAEKTIANLNDQVSSLQEEIQQLQKDETELQQISVKLEKLPELKMEVETLREIKSQVAIKEELLSRKKELSDRLTRLEDEKKKNEEHTGRLKEQLSAIPDDIDKLFEQGKQNLEAAREAFSKTRAEMESLNKEAGKLEAQLASVEELGPESVCDRCLRPFGDEYDDIRGHLTGELGTLKQEIERLNGELAVRKKSGEEMAAKVLELETRKKVVYQLKVDLSAVEKSQQEHKATSEDGRKKLADLTAQLERFEGHVFDPSKFEVLTANIAELETIQQKCDRLKGGLARLPVAEKNLGETRRKLDDTNASLLKQKDELEKLGVSEAEFAKVAGAFNEARNTLDRVKGELLAKVKEKELLQKELEGKLEQLKSFEKAAVELEQARSAHYYGEKLGRLFGDFRQNLIATIRPSLSEISSRLFSDMTDGRYSLVDLDEKYNLRVMDSGVYYGVDRFSGGEKDLANLSLRLAISLALTESAGLHRSFVILDEVFGSQDAQRKELILQAMAHLKSRFPQILLITHIDDVKDGVEEIIEVLPDRKRMV